MRIIAGSLKGRKLRTNPGMTTRPITDRAKERLFGRLEPIIAGRNVADIFAGTGTLGLESLSRGATGATFIEQDAKAAELLRDNVERFGVSDQSLCWMTDAFMCSYKPKAVPHLVPWGVVFFDPPYKHVESIKPGSKLYKALDRLAKVGTLTEDALLCFRTPTRVDFQMPPSWRPSESEPIKPMGGMAFHLYNRVTSTTVDQ